MRKSSLESEDSPAISGTYGRSMNPCNALAHQAVSRSRRQLLLTAALAGVVSRSAASTRSVRIGVDAEFGLHNSTSAQAIELGIRLAIAEVNAAGGVLKGRPLELVVRDNRSMPARALANLRELAAMPDLVAVCGGKFSPVMIESVPLAHELKVPLLAVWSSADPIVDNGRKPNFVFRLALRDSLAMPKMLATAQQRGLDSVGLMLANTGWGRSNLTAAERYISQGARVTIGGVMWFNWGERSFLQRYQSLREAGAKVVMLVSNDDDASVLVKEVAALPSAQRLPIICHQGITGGKFATLAGPALQDVDLSVLQTFSFHTARAPALKKFMETAKRVAGIETVDALEAPTGTAHAYDMIHLLALAIDRAGSANRSAVHAALESLPPHRGLIKHYRPAFSVQRHEALALDDLIMARYRNDGVIVPAQA